MELDLLVIGSGPSGQKAAIQAAKLGKRVAVAERRDRLGGVSIHTGTIPSKTLREAVLDQLAERPLDVLDPTRMEETEQQALQQLMDRAARVVAAETAVVREQFRRNMVGWLQGAAVFEDDHTVKIEGSAEPIHAERIVIAVGTRPARPDTVAFDDRTIVDSDGLLKLERRVPRTMTIVGAGVIGVEYASMFGALGTKVTVVDQRDRTLGFLDGEIGEAFQYLLRRHNVTFRLREQRRGDRVGRRTRAGQAGVRQGDRQRDRALRGRPPGRHGPPGDRAHRARGRQARADQGRRRLPHLGAAHLRGRRRRRRRARGDRDGAGPDRLAARLRPAGRLAARARPDRGLRDPRDRHGRLHRGGADRLLAPVRGRRRALDRARARADDRRRERPAEAARVPGRAQRPRRPRDRHRRDRARPHRPGGDGAGRRRARLPRHRGVQLPDVRGVLQGRRARRGEPDPQHVARPG